MDTKYELSGGLGFYLSDDNDRNNTNMDGLARSVGHILTSIIKDTPDFESISLGYSVRDDGKATLSYNLVKKEL